MTGHYISRYYISCKSTVVPVIPVTLLGSCTIETVRNRKPSETRKKKRAAGLKTRLEVDFFLKDLDSRGIDIQLTLFKTFDTKILNSICHKRII